MRALTLLSIAVLTLTAPLAFADTIDDFVFTNGTHTITYSLPATITTADYQTFTNISETSVASIDGTPGYTIYAQYDVFPIIPFNVILNVPSSIFGTTQFTFNGGSRVLTYITVPANNPAPYLPYNIVTTFTPGTYNFVSQPVGFPAAPQNYTLTITPEIASTPEPTTLALVATGCITGFRLRKRREADHQKH